MAIFCGNIEGFYELVNGQLGIAACASILKQTNKQKNRQASRRGTGKICTLCRTHL